MIYGLELDKSGRCLHYHSDLDIAALKCGSCQQYFACYLCHDHLRDHHFTAVSAKEKYPVLCGACHHFLSIADYKQGACPFCHHAFNPKCQLHDQIYFQGVSYDQH